MDETTLTNLLSQKNVPFRVASHKAVFNIAEASEAEGISPDKIVKNILLKSEKGFVLAVLCGDRKIDFDKIRAIQKTKKIRLATPEEVKEQTGVDIGTVNAFSYPVTIIDSGVLDIGEFNVHPDDNTKTVYFPTKYLKEILPNAVVAEIAKGM